MEDCIKIGPDAYEPEKILVYKTGTRIEAVFVLTDLGWLVCGPIKSKKSHNVFYFAIREDAKVVLNIQTMLGKNSYDSKLTYSVTPKLNCKHRKF